MSHTPGPLKRAGRWGNVCSAIADPTGGQIIATVWTHRQKALGRRAKGPDDYEEWPEGMANFNLMLAAPELLSIVLDILPNYHSDYSDGIHCDECGTRKSRPDQTECDVEGCWYVRIRSVIAKAKGGAA